MDESDILQELFNPDCLVPLEEQYGKPLLRLREPGAPDSFVEIVQIPNDLIAIDLDANFSNERLFQSGLGKGVCKRSDFILLSVQLRCAIFIEMKRGAPDASDIRKQLIGGLCAYEYVDRIIDRFYGKCFLASYSRRFIALLDTVAQKRPTKQVSLPLHDSPGNMLKLKGMKKLQFNQLARLTA